MVNFTFLIIPTLHALSCQVMDYKVQKAYLRFKIKKKIRITKINYYISHTVNYYSFYSYFSYKIFNSKQRK